MAVTAKLYPQVMGHLAQGRINWASDSIMVALVKGTYTPSESHLYWSDPKTHEAADSPASGDPGIGYTAQGKALSGKSSVYNSGTRVTSRYANNPVWTANLTDVKYVVLYKSTGTNSTSPLIGYVDLDWTNPNAGTVGSNPRGMFNKDLTVTWDAAGIVLLPALAF